MPTRPPDAPRRRNSGGKQYLDPALLEEAIRQIAAISAATGTPAMLVGGAAMQLYGSDRLTADIDVASDRLPPGLRATAPLSFGGIMTAAPNGVPLDWIVRDDDYTDLYLESLQHPVAFEGVPLPVVGPDYLAAMKLAAGRPKDEGDLLMLLQSGEVDPARARAIVRRHLGPYGAQEFDSRVAEASWRKK